MMTKWADLFKKADRAVINCRNDGFYCSRCQQIYDAGLNPHTQKPGALQAKLNFPRDKVKV